MTDTEFHFVAWIVALAIGLPTLAAVVWKRWRSAQAAFHWRAVLCVVVTCIFTPGIVIEDFDGNATVDVFPAAMALLSAPAGAFKGERGALEAGAGYGLLPILLVSLALIAIWSMILRVRKEVARC
jgi:hypothetical protein